MLSAQPRIRRVPVAALGETRRGRPVAEREDQTLSGRSRETRIACATSLNLLAQHGRNRSEHIFRYRYRGLHTLQARLSAEAELSPTARPDRSRRSISSTVEAFSGRECR